MSTAPNPTPGLTRPVFPTLQDSQNSSAFQSYSSSASLATPSSASSAPMPSPSANRPQQQQQGFFGSFHGQQPQQQQQPQMPPLQRHPTFEYQPNRNGAGQTAAETANFLNQTALLAEAAKRAQMACVMRDLDGMEL
jgi:hypothetical protein